MSCPFVHLVPYALAASEAELAEHYAQDAAALVAALAARPPRALLQVFPPDIHNPYPIGITLRAADDMRRVRCERTPA
jgi:hypothetical protein